MPRKSLDQRASDLNSWLSDCPPVLWMAEKLGVSISGAGAVWALLVLLWGCTGELICTVVGSFYPLYASFRALEDGEHAEVGVWMTYWITYAAFTLAEGAFRKLLSWVPFYHVLRLAFIVWLFFPATQGAQVIYAWTVGPLLRRHRANIDTALARCSQELNGSFCAEQLRGALSADRKDSSGDVSIEDFMAQELAKAAASRLIRREQKQAPPTPKSPRDAGAACCSPVEMASKGCVGSRTRTSSPRPVLTQKSEEEVM